MWNVNEVKEKRNLKQLFLIATHVNKRNKCGNFQSKNFIQFHWIWLDPVSKIIYLNPEKSKVYILYLPYCVIWPSNQNITIVEYRKLLHLWDTSKMAPCLVTSDVIRLPTTSFSIHYVSFQWYTTWLCVIWTWDQRIVI